MRFRFAVLWCLILARVSAAVAADPAPVAPPPAAPFEAEIVAFEAADKKNPPPPGAVEFLGSSSIRLWSTLKEDFPELTVINRGFGGSQISDSIHFADRIVTPYKPSMIVFYAGGNDINAGKTPARVLQDWQSFVEKVHAALPATRLVYISINPSVARWKQEDKVLEANRLIADYIRDNDGKVAKLSYIDSHAKLLSADGQPRPEILRPDGLHLNTQGYELWKAIVKPPVLALVEADKKAAGPVARVAAAQKSVEVKAAANGVWKPAPVGFPLTVHDQLRTGKRSKADIKFADGSLLRLGQLSSVTLESNGVVRTSGQAMAVLLGSGHILVQSAGPGTAGSTTTLPAPPVDLGIHG